MKYQAGDKVRCIKYSAAVGVRVGEVYTVEAFSHNSTFGTHIVLEEVLSTPTECVFELVESNPVLTPEEVFEHLRKGTELQYRRTSSLPWSSTSAGVKINDNPTYRMITLGEWRIKLEPEVIELNGKKYREIIE